MKKVAIYYRYSSAKDAQRENSEKRQKQELTQEALKLGWNIVWIDGDKETSGDTFKPKLNELKDKVESGEIHIDILYISSWDRLTRKDSVDYADDVRWIRDAGAKIAIKDKGSELYDLEDNFKLMMLQMEVFQANQYLKDLSKKVCSGVEARFKRGELGYTRIPFGFDRDEKNGIKPNADLAIVPMIFEQVQKDGIVSCIELLKSSTRYKKSKTTPTTSAVKTILRNPIYIGIRTYGVVGAGKHSTMRGEKTKTYLNVNRLKNAHLTLDVSDKVKPVVSEDAFSQVQELLEKNKSKYPKRNRHRKHKFSGLLRCGNCGAAMCAEKKVKHTNYVCPNSKNLKKGCNPSGRKTVHEDEIKYYVKKVTFDTWFSPSFHTENLHRAIHFVKKQNRIGTTSTYTKLEQIENKKKNLETLTNRVIDGSGEISQSMLDLIKQKQEEIHKEELQVEKDSRPRVNLFDILKDEKKISEVLGKNILFERYLKILFQSAIEIVEKANDVGFDKETHINKFQKECDSFFLAASMGYSVENDSVITVEKQKFELGDLLDSIELIFAPVTSKKPIPIVVQGIIRGVKDNMDIREHILDMDLSYIES